MATASASAASSGRGVSSSPNSNRTISCICILSAFPYPVTACLTVSGVYSATSSPASARARSVTPRACPTLIAVRTLLLKKSSSTAAAAGCHSIASAFTAR